MENVLDTVLDKLENVSEKIRRFSTGELCLLKVCCVTFGLLVGAFHARRVKKNALLILLAFLMSAVYMMIRICFDDEDEWDEDYDDDDDDFDPEEFMAGIENTVIDLSSPTDRDDISAEEPEI